MCLHESKFCPRCNAAFECKVGSITLCQCAPVRLTEEERAFLGEQYHDCLCADCMLAMKGEYHNRRFKNRLDRILGPHKYSEQ